MGQALVILSKLNQFLPLADLHNTLDLGVLWSRDIMLLEEDLVLHRLNKITEFLDKVEVATLDEV